MGKKQNGTIQRARRQRLNSKRCLQSTSLTKSPEHTQTPGLFSQPSFITSPCVFEYLSGHPGKDSMCFAWKKRPEKNTFCFDLSFETMTPLNLTDCRKLMGSIISADDVNEANPKWVNPAWYCTSHGLLFLSHSAAEAVGQKIGRVRRKACNSGFAKTRYLNTNGSDMVTLKEVGKAHSEQENSLET